MASRIWSRSKGQNPVITFSFFINLPKMILSSGRFWWMKNFVCRQKCSYRNVVFWVLQSTERRMYLKIWLRKLYMLISERTEGWCWCWKLRWNVFEGIGPYLYYTHWLRGNALSQFLTLSNSYQTKKKNFFQKSMHSFFFCGKNTRSIRQNPLFISLSVKGGVRIRYTMILMMI